MCQQTSGEGQAGRNCAQHSMVDASICGEDGQLEPCQELLERGGEAGDGDGGGGQVGRAQSRGTRAISRPGQAPSYRQISEKAGGGGGNHLARAGRSEERRVGKECPV